MQSESGYDRVFWLGYLSNGLTTIANGMMVRYSDVVTSLGGDEQQLGLIVGCGMVGSIAIRLFQGDAVDRYGAGRIWRWSLTLYSISLLMHLLLTTAYSPAIFLARMMMQASLAGVFGSSITFVSLRVRPQKMAEIIGTLGTSGFMGLMLGPLISDWLASLNSDPAQLVHRMLTIAAAFAVISVAATWFATQNSFVPPRHDRPSLWNVVTSYHPLMISLTAIAMGAGFAIPMTFLRPFSAEKGLDGVGTFFAVYAFTGLVARLASRSLFERFGNRPWIIVGMILLTISYACYLPITRTLHLIYPAMIAGVAHALLFPSVMSAGTSVFPRRYLGIATSLILTMFDVGTFLSAPLVGIFLSTAKPITPNAYGWMFAAVAVTFAVITVTFSLTPPGRRADP
ncbi:MAG: MFS transporter [Planctomyces sp.]|nr:MFS transporter [Planctomyces sp.]